MTDRERTEQRGGTRATGRGEGCSTPALADLSDEELACKAQAGSLSSFGELVDRFEGSLIGYLRRRVGLHDAQDLAQETFVRAWSSLKRYRPEYRFSTWIFTIASRLTTDHYRMKGRQKRMHEIRAHEAATSAPSQASRDDDVAEAHGIAEAIWSRAEEILNSEQLSALWLRYANDMSMADIASVLGKSGVATRVMLFRAREKLAAVMESDGVMSRHGEADGIAGGTATGRDQGRLKLTRTKSQAAAIAAAGGA